MQSEYMLNIKWRATYGVVLGMYLLAIFYFIWDMLFGLDFFGFNLTKTERFFPTIFITAVLLFFCSQWFYRIFLEKVIISKNGVQYYAFGHTIRTNWLNAKKIADSYYGIFQTSGIFIAYVPENIKTWFPGAIFKRDMYIPLSMFDTNWNTSELGQEIKQYAPHLFEQENKKSEQPTQKGKSVDKNRRAK